MRSFTIREILPEYHGMKDVIKKTFKNGNVLYHTREYPFSYEVTRIGACKLNIVDNEFGHFMHFFNSNNETVGVYKMTSRLRGFTKEQLAEQHSKLFFCKMFNPDKGIWETYVDGTPAKVSSYKEGYGLATILNDGHYYVVDKDNNYIVQPGKYDYIDGFDKCGLARVKIDGKADIFDPLVDIDAAHVIRKVVRRVDIKRLHAGRNGGVFAGGVKDQLAGGGIEGPAAVAGLIIADEQAVFDLIGLRLACGKARIDRVRPREQAGAAQQHRKRQQNGKGFFCCLHHA